MERHSRRCPTALGAMAAAVAMALSTLPSKAGENIELRSSDGDFAAAMRTGDYAAAVRLLEGRAKSGEREAQYLLASLYRSGRGVPQDDGAVNRPGFAGGILV